VQRLSVIREVIYSGVQLSLYSAEERVFAYWYATHVLELQLSCIDELLPGLQGKHSRFSDVRVVTQYLVGQGHRSMNVGFSLFS